MGSTAVYYKGNQYSNAAVVVVVWGGVSHEGVVCIKAVKDCHKRHAGLYS